MISAPRDPGSGLSGSALKHSPLITRKAVDSTSPLFAHALSTNERLESVVFRFVSAKHTAGLPAAIYFVQLTNASIAAYKEVFSNTPSGVYVGWQLVEEVAFYYQKIEWGFNEKVSASSMWTNGS